MRIGIFTNNYTPIISGITTYIQEYAQEFRRQGHEVYIFAPHYPGFKDEDGYVWRYPSLDLTIKTRYPLPLHILSGFEKDIQALDLDIIHSQHPLGLGTKALRIAKKFNIPIVFTNHTRYDLYAHYVPFIPNNIFEQYIIKKVSRYCNAVDSVIVPTNEMKVLLHDEWNVKIPITIIPGGLHINRYYGGDRTGIRTLLGFNEAQTVLFVVTRLASEKNISFLIRSFYMLVKDYPSLHLMIVGDGTARLSLELLVNHLNLQHQVTFTGEILHEEIYNYYSAGDIFVYSSLSETQGIIINEAMAASKPVVAVDAPGIRDIIEDGITGFLTRENELEFATTIERLLKDTVLQDKLVTAAYQRVESYSVQVLAHRMMLLYTSLKS